jgi:hypothetical protein
MNKLDEKIINVLKKAEKKREFSYNKLESNEQNKPLYLEEYTIPFIEKAEQGETDQTLSNIFGPNIEDKIKIALKKVEKEKLPIKFEEPATNKIYETDKDAIQGNNLENKLNFVLKKTEKEEEKKTEDLLKMVEREHELTPIIPVDILDDEKKEEETAYENNTDNDANDSEEEILKAFANTEKKAEEKNDLEEKILNVLANTEKESEALETEKKEEAEEEAEEEENSLEKKILELLAKTETEPTPEPEEENPTTEPEHILTIIIKKPEPEPDNVIITDKETDSSGNFTTTNVTNLNLEEDPSAEKKYKIKVTR